MDSGWSLSRTGIRDQNDNMVYDFYFIFCFWIPAFAGTKERKSTTYHLPPTYFSGARPAPFRLLRA